jgi:hypothetical protein
MPRRLSIVILFVAAMVVSASIAVAERPTIVQRGNLTIAFNGDVTPTKLPRRSLAPIGFSVSGGIETADGTQPPALKKFTIEADRNSAIDARGMPVCTAATLKAVDTARARRKCSGALVGEGTTAIEITLPEQPTITAKSRLLAFNGGVKGATTTIFVHAYLTRPFPAAVVTTAKVSKIHNGRYGLRSVARIPEIAGGYGSITDFELEVEKSFTYRGRKHSYLLAKCPDGHLNERATASFADGLTLAGEFARACTPTG